MPGSGGRAVMLWASCVCVCAFVQESAQAVMQKAESKAAEMMAAAEVSAVRSNGGGCHVRASLHVHCAQTAATAP